MPGAVVRERATCVPVFSFDWHSVFVCLLELPHPLAFDPYALPWRGWDNGVGWWRWEGEALLY